MVDRDIYTQSCIPVHKTQASPSLHNKKYVAENIVQLVSSETQLGDNGNQNSIHYDETTSKLNKVSQSKVPKRMVPKELHIDKGISDRINTEKGFETFLMTGDMIIKKNLSVKLQERHYSDSSSHSQLPEKNMFKRSASSPDQSTFAGEMLHDCITLDNITKVLENELNDESLKYCKVSAESGFEEQANHSDTGTIEKRGKLVDDPASLSDSSEVDSDDFLGNMAESQTSAVCLSPISTNSDLPSDISVNTVLLQEVEPLLNQYSSSSSTEDISSSDSFTEELSPEMIFERSLSDSGGLSPIYHKDVAKSFNTCKSAEKIIQKQLRSVQEHQCVRASKSQENYVGNDLMFVNIDIASDDMAYSLDQIPQPLEQTPTKEEHSFVRFQLSYSPPPKCDKDSDKPNKVSDLNDDRVFMSGFVKLDDSVCLSDKLKNLPELFNGNVNETNRGGNMNNDMNDFSNDLSVEDVLDTEAIQNDHIEFTDSDANSDNGIDIRDDFDEKTPTNITDLFAYQPAKSVDHPSAMRLAKRLYQLDGFRKSDVSRHLCKKNDFSILVAEEYLKFFDFTGDNLDVAIRKFLKQFSLIGETQERERILAHFSRHYVQSNAESFKSEDACHTLVCAMMLLNTDLHNQAVGRKMSCIEFIENLTELNDGENFPRDVLKVLYHAIKDQPIEWAPDDEFLQTDPRLVDEQRVVTLSQPILPSLPPVIGRNPFLDVPDPNQATEYKKGYIMRKCCVDPDGRKTAVGKRGWKMFYVVLRDMILYLYKDEQALKKSSSVGAHNAIRVHHCLASKASDYTKKQHVFRLQTADWAEYLFQTSNTKECQEWIDILNYVTATLSAPPLPGAIGSQKKFQRPLLRASYTHLNMQAQRRSFEEHLTKTEDDLQEHRQFPPEKGSKSSLIQQFLEKENYLIYEVGRLRTYIYLLQSHLTLHPELEPSLVETVIGEEEEGIKGLNINNHSAVISSSGSKKFVMKCATDRYSYRAAIFQNDRLDHDFI